MQRVLVTGGAGFIGSHTVAQLLAKNIEVVVLDNLFSGRVDNLDLTNPYLSFVEGDILELPLVEELLQDCDAVIHLAALVSVPLSLENPIYSFQVNVQGFLHILEAVKKSKRPIRVVYASSAAVYGAALDLPCQDAFPLTAQPLSPYALQKRQCEDYAQLYGQLYGLSTLGLRYFNVYGTKQHADSPYSGVITRFISAYKQDLPLTVYGTGEQVRDFIAVSDVAQANVLALQKSVTGVLNIATGIPHTLLNIIDAIDQAGDKKANVHYEPARTGDILSSYGTTTMAAQELGFTAQTQLSEGIRLLLPE